MTDPTGNENSAPENRIPVQTIEFVDGLPEEISELDPYRKREKVYTRKIEGFYQTLREYTGWPLLIVFFATPWISWNSRPVVWFDLSERQFHILHLTFWPQDLDLLAGLLIIAAMGLFVVTNFAGRIWCGYTCPQTVWTSIFMWIEQKTEGSRNQRIKLDKQAWTWQKFSKKVSKHTMWLTVSLLTAIGFVAYFYPVRNIIQDLVTLDLNSWGAFWIFFFTWCTYINAGWLREQVCMYMCPYARFQSVMFDQDTLIVSYDKKRGEPRGSRKRSGEDDKKQKLGDCVDCELCVQVCPTGIDIRHGLQYECIGCALCIDACNSIMDKMNTPRGLIRYTTEHQLEGGHTHIFRPRLIAYISVLLIIIGAFLYQLTNRSPLELDVIRDRSSLFTTTSEGYIENVYTIKILNKTNERHTFFIAAQGLDELEYIGNDEISLNSGEIGSLAMRLKIDPGLLQKQSSTVNFTIEASDDATLKVEQEARFIGPSSRH